MKSFGIKKTYLAQALVAMAGIFAANAAHADVTYTTACSPYESTYVTTDHSTDGKLYIIQAPVTNGGQIVLGGTLRASIAGVLLNPGDIYTADPTGHDEVLSEFYDLTNVEFLCSYHLDSLIWKVL